MQIKSLAVEETAFLHLRSAGEELLYEAGKDGYPDKTKPVGITFYSPGSKAYAKAQTARSNRIVDRFKSKGKANRTAEETKQENAAFLVACTHSMQHMEVDKLEGEALFQAVYDDPTLGFIVDQSAAFASDWANFSKALPKI